jgi:uncharacterized protein
VNARSPLVIAAPVLGEAFYLVGKYLGPVAEAQLVESLADARFEIVVPTRPDLERAAELIRQYADLPLGGTDALIIATAERYDVTEVATLDHRHFGIVRPRHCDAFELVP